MKRTKVDTSLHDYREVELPQPKPTYYDNLIFGLIIIFALCVF